MEEADAWDRWVAGHVLADLRSGVIPRGLTPRRFSWNPTVVALRSLVQPDDREVAIGLLGRTGTLMWGAFLARVFADDAAITATLIAAFESETDLDRAIGLFHHLAARPLSDPQYQILRSWTQRHAADLIDEQREAFSDSEGPARLRERLASERPDWTIKRWVYMYSALILDADEARAVLHANRESADARVVDAAEHALTLLN